MTQHTTIRTIDEVVDDESTVGLADFVKFEVADQLVIRGYLPAAIRAERITAASLQETDLVEGETAGVLTLFNFHWMD